MNPKPELPTPDESSARHSRRVARHLAGLIGDAGGSIPFSQFMQEALYAPGIGYYVSGTAKLGEGGDFTTAPEISSLFGAVVARQSVGILEQTGGEILEFGAGTGSLAVAVLQKLKDLGELPGQYLILEASADLRERQATRFDQELPWFTDHIRWIDEIPTGFQGVVLANEVADAMPVERFRIQDRSIQRTCVTISGSGFDWCYEDAPPILERAVREIESSIGMPLQNGYESEVSLAVSAWTGDLCRSIEAGAVLMIDYGLPRREYYAPERHSGWLRCHYQHRAHDNPLVLAGIQDLTSWVDFTAVADAARQSGATVAGFLTQAHFLMLGGLEVELAEFADLPLQAQVDLSGQVKRLTLPSEMGENFKCIGLVRGDVDAPPVFGEADQSHRL